jgi:hypothetical protein
MTALFSDAGALDAVQSDLSVQKYRFTPNQYSRLSHRQYTLLRPYLGTTNVVDTIKELLEEDRNIAVFFLYARTPRSDDDGERGLRYPDD